MAGDTTKTLNTRFKSKLEEWQGFVDNKRNWQGGSTDQEGKRKLIDAVGRETEHETPAQLEKTVNEAITSTSADPAAMLDELLMSAIVPRPDFHLPLNDNIMIREGVGTPYQEGLPIYKADFTRSSTATYVDKSGVLKVAGVNEPRFEKEGILIEGSGTNLLFHSEDLTNKTNSQAYHSVWTDTGNKFGDVKIFSVTDDGYGGFQWWRRLEPITADGTFTGSVYVHTTGVDTPETAVYRIRFSNGTVRLKEATGVISLLEVTGQREVHLEHIAPGIYKLIITFELVAGSTPSFGLHCDRINGYAMNFSCWQLEQSPIPTSYIPTNGTAVTRTPDNLKLHESLCMPATHSEATIVFEMDFQDNNKDWQSFISSANCFSYGQYSGQGSISVYGATKYPFSSVGITDNQPFIYCIRKYKDRYQMLVNGEVKGEVAVSEYNSDERGITILGNNRANGDRPIFGHIRNFRMWNQALSDLQIASLGSG